MNIKSNKTCPTNIIPYCNNITYWVTNCWSSLTYLNNHETCLISTSASRQCKFSIHTHSTSPGLQTSPLRHKICLEGNSIQIICNLRVMLRDNCPNDYHHGNDVTGVNQYCCITVTPYIQGIDQLFWRKWTIIHIYYINICNVTTNSSYDRTCGGGNVSQLISGKAKNGTVSPKSEMIN